MSRASVDSCACTTFQHTTVPAPLATLCVGSTGADPLPKPPESSCCRPMRFWIEGLIVSVQAPPGSPMRDPEVIAAMADASLRNGAVGVRLESPEHIGAVRRRCPDALIIGLWKCTCPDSSVYITPGWREIQAVWSAGADVIAIDASSSRPRRGTGSRGSNLNGRALSCVPC